MKAVATLVLGLFVSANVFAAELARSDRDFLEKAAHAGHMEIAGSKLAQEKASSPEIKSFAEQMIKDHSAMAEELNKLASSKGVKLPAEPSVAQKGKLKVLNAYKGANFDKHYARQVGVSAHETTLKLFQRASQDVQDAEVKAFATKSIPSLEKHLEMAQALPGAKGKVAAKTDKK